MSEGDSCTLVRNTQNGESFHSSSESNQSRPSLFGRIAERRVTFCVDTSGSMYSCLDTVKEHLIDALCEMAQRCANDEDAMFNVLEFSTEIVSWADKMVRCTPETVAVAVQWIQNLMPKTGTNTLDALTSAFRDPNCQAVYLVTDSVPDTFVDDVIDATVAAAGNRPVHALYVHDGEPDRAAADFLRELAMETYGSFHVVTIAQHGPVERVTPIYRAEASAERIVRTTDGNIYPSNHKTCSVVTSLDEQSLYRPQFLSHQTVPYFSGPTATILAASTPPYPYCLYPWPYRHYYYYAQPAGSTASRVGWSRYRPAKAWLKHAHEFINGVTSLTPGAGTLLINVSVLARRHADGFFYRATTKNQVWDI